MRKTIYHGDNYGTTRLDPKRMNAGNNQEGVGIYFSDEIEDTRYYGKYVVSLEIDDKDFFPARAIISDFVKDSVIINFLKECNKVNDEFWYLLTDYGVEVMEPEEIKEHHWVEFANLIKENEIRNFQVAICEVIGEEDFVKLWKKYFKKQGTKQKQTKTTWYAVIYTDNKINMAEQVITLKRSMRTNDYILEKGDRVRVRINKRMKEMPNKVLI